MSKITPDTILNDKILKAFTLRLRIISYINDHYYDIRILKNFFLKVLLARAIGKEKSIKIVKENNNKSVSIDSIKMILKIKKIN